jgi:hypothetical protein
VLLETANPELAPLVKHGGERGFPHRGLQRLMLEQPSHEKQSDHRNAGA